MRAALSPISAECDSVCRVVAHTTGHRRVPDDTQTKGESSFEFYERPYSVGELP